MPRAIRKMRKNARHTEDGEDFGRTCDLENADGDAPPSPRRSTERSEVAFAAGGSELPRLEFPSQPLPPPPRVCNFDRCISSARLVACLHSGHAPAASSITSRL